MSTYRLDTGSVADWQITQRLVTNHVRNRVLFSPEPRIAVQAYIGFSRPILTAGAYVPGYCI